jgi:outer membrane biosynthesis protein TonB
VVAPTKAPEKPAKQVLSPVEMRLAKSVANAIRRQIEQNWNVPAGALDARELKVEIRIVLRPDGTVVDARIVDSGRLNRAGEEFFRTMAESAVRAVWRASPLRDLPPRMYDQWREITFTFIPPA